MPWQVLVHAFNFRNTQQSLAILVSCQAKWFFQYTHGSECLLHLGCNLVAWHCPNMQSFYFSGVWAWFYVLSIFAYFSYWYWCYVWVPCHIHLCYNTYRKFFSMGLEQKNHWGMTMLFKKVMLIEIAFCNDLNLDDFPFYVFWNIYTLCSCAILFTSYGNSLYISQGCQ